MQYFCLFENNAFLLLQKCIKCPMPVFSILNHILPSWLFLFLTEHSQDSLKISDSRPAVDYKQFS